MCNGVKFFVTNLLSVLCCKHVSLLPARCVICHPFNMGNQQQREHIKAAQSHGNAKFSEILDQHLNQFSDAEIHAFLDRVVDQVDSQYSSDENTRNPTPKAQASKHSTGDSETFKVRKIAHINSLYEVEEKISGGSSCTVMKAREFRTGNVVAGSFAFRLRVDAFCI